MFQGPVEVDETYVGGSEGIKHASERSGSRGPKSKWPVIGILKHPSCQVRAEAIDNVMED